MPIPTSISDLNSTASSNSPAGTDAIGTTLDDYIRAHAAIIRQVSDAKANLTSAVLVTPNLGTPSAGVLTNCTGTASGLTAGTATTATTATNQSGGTVNAVGGISRNGTLLVNDTAPTIASGFGTGASIVASNGSIAFEINVGTGGTAAFGAVNLPAAPNGWACHAELKGNSVADQLTRVFSLSTTQINIVNRTISTGSTTAWASGSILEIICIPY